MVNVKGIGIFHQKLTRAHDAKTWTDFITELGLDLVKSDRQLLVAANLVTDKIGHDLFVCRAKAIIAAGTVFYF